jgi:hypothetical protein
MTVLVIARILEKFRRRGTCVTCQVDGIDGLLLDQFPEIQFVTPWKHGQLYQCSRCASYWFMHEHKKSIDRIYEELLPLANYWNESSLTLHPVALNSISSIGGILEHYRDCIAVPCLVKCKSGQQFEKAVVLVSRKPPHQWYEPDMVHWSDEIESVEVSRYALPLDVRRESAEKEEVSMGFAPVGIVDRQGREYTLHCESRFFDYEGVKGDEIRLSGRMENWKERVPPSPAEAFFFADWFEGCEEVLLKRKPA